MQDELTVIIRDLERCATQNEADARAPGGYDSRECDEARAVAAEQRRMIGVLKTLRGKV